MVTNEELMAEFDKLPYDNCIKNTDTCFVYNIKTGLLNHQSKERGMWDYFVIPGSWFPVWECGVYIYHVQSGERFMIGEI